MKQFIFASIIMLFCLPWAFPQKSNVYMPKEIKQAYENGTRSPDGNPGTKYWQNSAKYNIEAELDPINRKLIGKETIAYHNNSPDTLKVIVIKLLQNFHQTKNARDLPVPASKLNDGISIEKLVVNGKELDVNSRNDVIVYGTNLYARMKKTSRISPESITEIEVEWHFKIPDLAMRVGAYTDSSFFMGYWFPQVAVYDDVFGWDTEQYTGLQETYNDLADFDVKISVPQSYIVWATGVLQNGHRIFSKPIHDRIEQSKTSNQTVHVLKQSDYLENKIFRADAQNVWHYVAKSVPDFAFGTSSYYLWDAKKANTNTLGTASTWVNAVYPPNAREFKNAIDWASSSIEYFSTEFPAVPFPYEKHISFNGQDHAAIEFPMIANDCDSDSKEFLAEIIAHEIAHTYFPFLVLTNERLCAWMDEGWVKLIGERYTEKLGKSRENFKALNTAEIYNHYAGTFADMPLITSSASLSLQQNFSHSYAKADNANVYLFEMLKSKGIEAPLKHFINQWAGKHPTPWDYFNSINKLAGEDLSWYWKPWYFNYAYPDLTLDITSEGNSPMIMVTNNGGLPVPVVLKITCTDGKEILMTRSAEIWDNNKTEKLYPDLKVEEISRVELGEKYIIDVYPEDNVIETNTLQSHHYRE